MNKTLKYLLRSLAVVVGLIIILYSIALIYVAFNRQSIVSQVRTKISEKLNGDVSIGDVDISFFSHFPRIAVVFKNIAMKDSMYAQHGHTFFSAGELAAKISVINVILNEEPLSGLTIKNGSMYIYTDTSGYSNSYLLKPRQKQDVDTGNQKGNVLNDITVKQFRFVLDNKQRKKLYDIDVASLYTKIKSSDTLLTLNIENSSVIHNLSFNVPRGSFVKESSFEGDFDLKFSKTRKQLYFKEIEVEIKNQPFLLSGEFDFGDLRTYHLNVKTDNIGYEFGKSLVTAKIAKALSIVKVEKPIDVVADISGVFTPSEPLVSVTWKSSPNNIQSPFFNVTNASFTGGYTNELVKGGDRNDPNSRIYIKDFTGNWEGLDIHSANTTIDDLVDPIITTDLQSKFHLQTLNNLLESSSIILKNGDGDLNITYKGPMQENSSKNTSINGRFNFSGGEMLYAPRNVTMENSKGSIIFKNTDVQVKDFSFNVKENKLVINGNAANILSLMRSNPGKASLNWQVYSPSLNLGMFTSLLAKRATVTVTPAKKGKLKKVASQIDQLMNESNVQVSLKADKILFKKFEATHVNASIDMEKEDYNLKNVSFDHANGRMVLNGKLIEKNNSYYAASIKANMLDVDISKVLYAFNNFGQDALMSSNIKGQLSSYVSVNMNIDRALAASPTNLEGVIDFSLKNGELVDFEPMKKLQVFLFKNRDFQNLQFAELKNTFTLKDQDIKINRMEIQSSALTLFVEGVYSLRGNTDISIQVPLSNLKKRGEDYKPENIGADAKAGPSVFVRGTPGEDGNIKFKLDVLNKIRKRLKGKDKADEKVEE